MRDSRDSAASQDSVAGQNNGPTVSATPQDSGVVTAASPPVVARSPLGQWLQKHFNEIVAGLVIGFILLVAGELFTGLHRRSDARVELERSRRDLAGEIEPWATRFLFRLGGLVTGDIATGHTLGTNALLDSIRAFNDENRAVAATRAAKVTAIFGRPAADAVNRMMTGA